ncbi:MAG: hypothetical protein WAS55_00140 [Saprospiraceae bacterium]|nr:hypothetical protein [Saprospiraceae bacterium]
MENRHIILWLLKDVSWMLGLKIIASIIMVPTFLLAFYICYKSRKIASDFYHNLAVSFWIIANGIWMFGEFYFENQTKTMALASFILGIVSLLYYYLIVKKIWLTN